MNSIQINLVADELSTLLSALAEENVHPSLQHFVRPLEIKLEMAERALLSVTREEA